MAEIVPDYDSAEPWLEGEQYAALGLPGGFRRTISRTLGKTLGAKDASRAKVAELRKALTAKESTLRDTRDYNRRILQEAAREKAFSQKLEPLSKERQDELWKERVREPVTSLKGGEVTSLIRDGVKTSTYLADDLMGKVPGMKIIDDFLRRRTLDGLKPDEIDFIRKNIVRVGPGLFNVSPQDHLSHLEQAVISKMLPADAGSTVRSLGELYGHQGLMDAGYAMQYPKASALGKFAPYAAAAGVGMGALGAHSRLQEGSGTPASRPITPYLLRTSGGVDDLSEERGYRR